jgi:hypothetical protein
MIGSGVEALPSLSRRRSPSPDADRRSLDGALPSLTTRGGVMKTAFSTAALAAVLATPGVYGGTYDGVWSNLIFQGEFLIVRHREEAGQIGVALVSRNDGTWDAAFGSLQGNLATFDGVSVNGGADLRATMEFSTPDSATFTVTDCVPLALECDFPLNVPIPIQRVF